MDGLASVLETIRRRVPGAFEVYRRYEFFGHRDNADGGEEKFYVEVLDAGPDVEPTIRYHASVTTESGQRVVGNPAESMQMAVINVHVEKLDASVQLERGG